MVARPPRPIELESRKSHGGGVSAALLRWRMTILLVAGLFLPQLLSAQVDSRAAEIESARKEKMLHLEPDEPSRTERGLLYFKEGKLLERVTGGVAGFRVKLGGLVTGGGFALGPEYLRRDLAGGNLIFRTAAQASIKKYERMDLELGAPHFANNKLFFDFFSVYHNYPGISYYGPGPLSRKTSRSNFRLEDTALDSALGVRPIQPFKFGVSGGYLFVNVGPGGDTRFVSADKVFTPQQASGIDRQSNFLRYGAFAQFDYRDNPGGPRKGGNYLVQFDVYSDRTLRLHDFRRLHVDLQQYIPFFNERHVIALRATTTRTYTSAGQTVPFYLQPTLGGPNDLRGFRAFRFYDDNMLLLNGEYRWEVFSGLDMALFADGGKVFPRSGAWNLSHLEGSGGFGLRFNVLNNVFLRIDAGFSHEGAQVWFKFDNIYRGERIRSSTYQ